MDIEKLKALALAANYAAAELGAWPNVHQIADGITMSPIASYVANCSAATVLELIAENERLRADAERYRWLRDEAEGMAGKAAPMVCRLDEQGRFVDYLDGEELDSHIDRAAITASKEKASA